MNSFSHCNLEHVKRAILSSSYTTLTGMISVPQAYFWAKTTAEKQDSIKSSVYSAHIRKTS